jgi:hypothetical protein
MQNGGSVRGYQAIFVPLAAVRSPGYSPLDGQPAVYFSLSHKRHEDLIDLYIWDTRPKAMLDLVMLRRSPGFMQQADLYIAALEVIVLNCRRQGGRWAAAFSVERAVMRPTGRRQR